jgi:hypothetical protein
MIRSTPLAIGLLLTGCGSSAPQADITARTWKYYTANPAEIEPMQKICLQWSGSNAPAVSEPAVIAANCRAAAFAKSMLKSPNAGSK